MYVHALYLQVMNISKKYLHTGTCEISTCQTYRLSFVIYSLFMYHGFYFTFNNCQCTGIT